MQFPETFFVGLVCVSDVTQKFLEISSFVRFPDNQMAKSKNKKATAESLYNVDKGNSGIFPGKII